MSLTQSQRRQIDSEFRDQREAAAVHGDIFAWEERVYQYTRHGIEIGTWMYICPQADETCGSSGFDFTLSDGVVIHTSAERLVEILLRTHGSLPAEKAAKMCQLFFGMLMEQGWSGPLMTVPTRIAGTVVVTTETTRTYTTKKICTDDIRPILVNLMDVNAHSVCVPETPTEEYPFGRFHRLDFLSSKIEVIPDAVTTSKALASLRTQAFPDRPVDKSST